MAVKAEVLIQSKYAENSQTTQYTSTAITTSIDKFTATNATAATVTFAVNLVPSGDAAGAANLVYSGSILSGDTWTFPELVGQLLAAGDFISTDAGTATALVIRSSGRLIS